MAVTSIWIHVNKKAQQDKVTLQRPIPQALSGHVEFLKQCLGNKTLTMSDYRIILLCNAYSTNSELFAPPMGILVEGIYGNNQKSISLPGNVQALTPIQPLSMNVLDSLTVHAKMSLIHSIVTRIMKLAQTKLTSLSLAPALVETYSRLLVYTEIESLGIKGFISQLLPSVFKSNAWGILHTLLEMFSYRLHHMQPHYRIQLLSQLHQLSQSPLLNQYQLYLCVENTALHLIMGLGSWEVQPQLTRVVSETKSGILLSNDSEELNRAMVLILARTVSVQGLESISSIWCKEILTNIMTATPLSWPSYSTACFPPAIAEFFQQQVHQQREDKQSLKRKVEGEYRVWKSCMAAENDLITHFATQGIPLFFCVLWKTLQEDNRIAPTAYKVLERLGPRAMAAHLRMFADFLICEFSMSTANQHVNRLLDTLNDLVWKWCIIPIDRLVLCLTLRNVEDNEASVCCFIMFCLLHRCQEFRSRVQDFVKENSPDHWLQSNWYDKHVAFHKKYPEKYYFEMVPEMAQQPQHQCLPVFFGNVCLRFIPVFDLVIHRFIELPPIAKHIETLLDSLGGLYKFHDRPLTYLYNTLHYYDKRLQERTNLKRKLVQAIVGSFKEIKPSNWCLTEDFMQYLEQVSDDWSPDSEYYLNLIGRLVDTISGLPVFPACDWRFNEFPNAAAHGLYVTSIELMALPVNGPVVGNALYDVVFKGIMKIPREKIFSWLNAVGMVITTLPECYWIVLYDRIVRVLQDGQLAEPSLTCDPFQMFNFSKGHQVIGELDCGYLLALCHAVWVHTSIGQISTLIPFMKERLKPIVKTEEQLLYVCHLFGPFLQRFHVERTRCVLDFTLELYEMLSNVDKAVEHMRYIDPISDFLYHIKYMFVGDGVKNEVEKIIRTLRPSLQLRLRFIAHHSKDESTAISQPPVVTSS